MYLRTPLLVLLVIQIICNTGILSPGLSAKYWQWFIIGLIQYVTQLAHSGSRSCHTRGHAAGTVGVTQLSHSGSRSWHTRGHAPGTLWATQLAHSWSRSERTRGHAASTLGITQRAHSGSRSEHTRGHAASNPGSHWAVTGGAGGRSTVQS